ncbi:hypothetical protein A2837_01705 [Candidatus Kaiserbacteria bacterium RIFCSPHIGHO2_01_FULL_46_22]|uniref:Cation/H+ exchanger transmembrane domain-containing protein n=1 Tax=Candidatus Kaiserbacteria bacterium RIFCSPHIGHO2_01_FULL_46_22 TaxID=1798475 RepID=A0A1F6BY70_9BACT|nr:MAG: hypothetical protein A2837_01705 [Candidatus Kaiserbacteria bacterium RIFCSPHIGHO2_01_FULL_46_22]
MGLTLESALALFVLLIVSTATFFLAKRTKLPYTVLLVAVGLILVPIAALEPFHFLETFTLTPALLFYLLLPTLIFESAYNMSIRKVYENKWSITILSVVSLLVSSLLISGTLYSIFTFLLGIEVPFLLWLLFGALISATDPVAVLALFKEYGAPRRLTLLFEGESLFNDGTAVAFFFVLLSVIALPVIDPSVIVGGVITFMIMVIGGIVFGIIMGGVFSKMIEKASTHEFVAISLMIVSAHLTFIFTDLISEYLGHHTDGLVKLSPIISTTLAAMVIGNYGRFKVSPKADEFIEKFWGQFAFLANSLVFILIGLLFTSISIPLEAMLAPIVIVVLVVAVSRAVSIYPIVTLLNWTKIEEKIPNSWQHLLAWGSLRGALAITMVLLIPDDLTFANWGYTFTPKEFILGLTIGCIYATLFIKATTIGLMMRKLKLDALTEIEVVEEALSEAIIHSEILRRLSTFKEKGYISEGAFNKMVDNHRRDLGRAQDNCRSLLKNNNNTEHLADKVLRMHALGIEKYFLKNLYTYGEISEKIFKRILSKLTLQMEQVEKGNFGVVHSNVTDYKDVFERLANFLRRIFFPKTATFTAIDKFRYYRAQTVIARKVLKELHHLQTNVTADLISSEAVERLVDTYTTFKEGSTAKMNEMAAAIPEEVEALNSSLVGRGLLKTEESIIKELYEKEMITPKLMAHLTERMEQTAQ